MSEISMRVIFGKRFRSLRMNGETQSQFAERLGLTRSTVAAYECGRAIPPIVTLSRICRLYRCSMDWLIGLADAKARAMEETAVEEVMQDPDAPEQVTMEDAVVAAPPEIHANLPYDVCRWIKYLNQDDELAQVIGTLIRRDPEHFVDHVRLLWMTWRPKE